VAQVIAGGRRRQVVSDWRTPMIHENRGHRRRDVLARRTARFIAWRPALLAGLVLVAAPPVSARADWPEIQGQGRIVVLDDFSRGTGAWESAPAAEVVVDERSGKPALALELGDAEARLVYRGLDRLPDFGRYNRVRIRVRAWDDDGRQGVGGPVRASMNISGWPSHPAERTPQWGLYDRCTVASDDWRLIEERLDFPAWYPWEKTDNRVPGLRIDAGADFGAPAHLRIGEIVLIDDLVDVQGEWGSLTRLTDGSIRWDYEIALKNRTAEVQRVTARLADPLPARFAVELPEPPLALEPRGSAVLRVQAVLSAAAVAEAPLLMHEDIFLDVVPEALPESSTRLRLAATAPLKTPPRPVLFKTSAQWEADREAFAALDEKARGQRLRQAATWLERPVALPRPYDKPRPLTLVDGSTLEPPPLDWQPLPEGTPAPPTHANWFQAVQTLGEAYQLTLDDRYARQAAAIVKAYAERLDDYPLRGITTTRERGWTRFAINNLHEGWALMPLCLGYDMVRDVPGVLTEEDKKLIADRFLIPMGRIFPLITSGHTNMTAVRNMAAALCGFCADDPSLIQYAVFGHSGLERSIDISINPDGFLTEIPLNYHWANLKEKLHLATILRNTGLEVPYRRDLLEKACRVPYLRAFPDGHVPGFGPHGYGKGPGYGAGEYRNAAAVFGDPLFAELVDADRGREIIADLDSVHFPASELVVLRQGKGAARQHAVSFLFGNKRRAHDAALAFTWYGAGELLAPALGSLYNCTPLMPDPWLPPFSCQIGVDDLHQAASTGRLTYLRIDPGPQIASAAADGIFPGVRAERTLAIHDGLLFVADRLVSDAEHDFQWTYLTMGELSLDGQFQGPDLASSRDRLELTGRATDGAWRATWQRPKLNLTAWMLGAPGTHVLSGDAYIAPCGDAWRTPLVLARRRAKEALFLTVLAPGEEGRSRLVSVQPETLPQPSAAAAAVRVKTDDGREHVFVVNYPGAELTGPDWKTSARADVITPNQAGR